MKSMNKSIFLSAVMVSFLTACGGGDSQDQDPTVRDFAVAYIERPVPTDNNDNPISLNSNDVTDMNPGAVLFIKRRASLGSSSIDVSSRIIGTTGDVKDPEFSRDGSKLIFSAIKEDPDPNDTDPETWDLYEYDLATDTVTPVFTTNQVRDRGHDLSPHYLPNLDGNNNIVFSSTRQQRSRAILLDEGVPNNLARRQVAYQDEDRDEEAAVLHTYDKTTTTIRQISFNASHDLDPTVLLDGRIMFTRWENFNSDHMSLYTINPDGTGLQAFYGVHSHATGTNNSTIQFLDPREISSGQVMFIGRPETGTFEGGDVYIVNTDTYVDDTTPTTGNAGVGPAQSSATGNRASTEPGFSLGGRFSSAFPFRDGTSRALVSFTQCIVDLNGVFFPCSDDQARTNPNAVEAPPRYGLFVYDYGENNFTAVVLPQENIYYTDAVVAQDPANLPRLAITDTTDGSNTGTIHLRTIYATDGTFNPLGTGEADVTGISTNVATDNRPARFVRFIKKAPFPEDVNLGRANFGLGGQNLMREIVGYAEIAPDGSVWADVPADVPLTFQIVDKDGKRLNNVAEHGTWLQVRSGETVTCVGCHAHNAATGAVHGRDDVSSNLITDPIPNALLSTNPGATAFANSLIQPPTNTLMTMAEARAANNDTAFTTLNFDLDFDDAWSAVTAPGASIKMYYDPTILIPPGAGNAVPASPASTTCILNWSPLCRAVINYVDHIQPIWEAARTNTVGDSVRCIDCHTTLSDPADPNSADRVPAGYFQLDLTQNSFGKDANNQDADFYKSYIELLGDDQFQFLDPGNANQLTDELRIDNDGDGNPDAPESVFAVRTGSGNRIARTTGANNSNNVFNVFSGNYILKIGSTRITATQNVGDQDAIHWDPQANGGAGAPILTPGELKLIAEWLDLGARYYNDPFRVP